MITFYHFLKQAFEKKSINFIEFKDLNVIIEKIRYGYSLKNTPNINIEVTKHSLEDFYEKDINENEIEAILSSEVMLVCLIMRIGDDYYLLVEYANQGNLECYLKENTLNWDQRVSFATQLASGLDFLHSRNMVHLDLNPKNVFIHQGILKITNFGAITIFRPTDFFERISYIDPQELRSYIDDSQNFTQRIPSSNRIIQIVNGTREEPILNTSAQYFQLYQNCWQADPGIDKESLLQSWNLHKGLNIRVNDLIPGKQVLTVDGKIRYVKKKEFIRIYTNRNIVNSANSLISRSNVSSNRYAEESSIRLHIPLLQVEYIESKATGEFIEIIKEALKKQDQVSVSQSVIIGGALMIKPTSHEPFLQDIKNLKAHVYWAYDQIISGKPNVFDQVQFDNFMMIDANNNKRIISGYGLKAWMKNFYEHEDGYVISYNRIIPVYSLFNDEIKQNLRKNLEKFDDKPINTEFIPNINNFDNMDLNTWISCSPKIYLSDWVNNLNLRYGLVIQPRKIGRGLETAINFIGIPDIRSYSNSYMRLLQPSSKKEAFTLTNCIELNDIEIPFLTEKLMSDNFHPMFDCQPTSEVHCFIFSEKIKLIINADKVEPSEILIRAVNEAIENKFPFRSLKNVFDKFGHLWPQKIILGWTASRIYKYNSINKDHKPIDYELSLNNDKFVLQSNIMDKLQEWKNLLKVSDTCTFFMDSNGKIVKDCDIYFHLHKLEDQSILNPETYSQLRIVRLENLIPLYKILSKATQNIVENIFSDDFHIVMTGVAEIKRENQTHVNIQFAQLLQDDDYEMFGNLVTNNLQRISDVMIRFSLSNRRGCRATIHKFNRSIPIGAKVFWIMLAKGNGYFSKHTRDIKLLNGKEVLPGQSSFTHKLSISNVESYFPDSFIFVTSFDSENLDKYQVIQGKIIDSSKNNLNLEVSLYNTENQQSNELIALTMRWCAIDINPDQDAGFIAQIGIGETIKPFIPMIVTISILIKDITEIYEKAQFNKKICNSLLDRAKSAEAAINTLQRRKQENEEKFRSQLYYNSFMKFKNILEKIKNFAGEVTQIREINKYINASYVKDKFLELTSEYDKCMEDLHFKFVIAQDEQRRYD
ncbi:23566_t:CDS:2 [Gigaspora margarita]|uniref:23566_t:CDS:1 n=1 Tax=Gigaspora margarita TaxID=4874 RepID=A0ABM8W0Q0_GIGMA|nr:23566_t:CDS:2 [Gigaspora margarita]